MKQLPEIDPKKWASFYNQNIVPVITIDGPSGTGKGTLSHCLANHLHWRILDSGILYRILAYAAQKKAIVFDNTPDLIHLTKQLEPFFKQMIEKDLKHLTLYNENINDVIRNESCGKNASILASNPNIREVLIDYQRAFARFPGLITDGRDMGTVIFPDALLKIYLDATPIERAKRRYLQLKERGIDVNLANIINELAERDARDMKRSHAPLKMATDAICIDTTRLTIAQLTEHILKLIADKISH